MKSLFIIVLFLFAGCTVQHPQIVEYRIAPNVKISTFDANSCRDKSLKIAYTFANTSFMSNRMKYAQNNFEEFSFSESKWVNSPNKALTQEILESTRASHLFKSVNGFKSRSKNELVLESSIEDFMQYFTKNNTKSHVRVVLSFALINMKSGEALSTKRITKIVAVDPNARAGVKGLNNALSDVLLENNKWLNSVCQ